MRGIALLLMRGANAAQSDVQTVTTGADGSALENDRRRGFDELGLGSISDGTSNIYGGAAIETLHWAENGGFPFYKLTITGAANAGWVTMTIGSKVLTRNDASYVGGIWTWNTTDTVAAQAFGGSGASRTVVFA